MRQGTSDSIKLGPLNEDECRSLIRDNLSKRIHIDDSVIDFSLHLSVKRPEDIQFIMKHALEHVFNEKGHMKTRTLVIKKRDIQIGFAALVEKRGYHCFTIWKNISKQGQSFIEKRVKSTRFRDEDPLKLEFQATGENGLGTHDISVFQGYGFANPEGTQLVVPMYFQEWVRKEFYKKEYKYEEEEHEQEN